MFIVFLRWTGKGWLSIVIFVVSVIGAAWVGSLFENAFPEVDGIPAASVLVFCVVFAALSPAHWIVGRALNSIPDPEGRIWHNAHSFGNAPMQAGAFAQAILALLLSSLVVGKVASAWAGWATFLGIIVAVVWLRHRRRLGKQLRSVADRDSIAEANDWRYVTRDSTLALRWKESYGRRLAYTLGPFGVLVGEIDGRPFTLFDGQETRATGIVTVYVVHLPMAYPSVRVDVGPSPAPSLTSDQWAQGFSTSTPDQELVDAMTDSLRIRPEQVHTSPAGDAFGQALLGPEVREVTARHRLLRWWIQGRDVIFMDRPGDKSPTAEEALRGVRKLIELANAFPPGLAERYGTSPPTTDLPLRPGSQT